MDKVLLLGSKRKLSCDELNMTGLESSPSLFHVVGLRIDNCEFNVGQLRKWQDGFVQIKMIVSEEGDFKCFCEKYEISSFSSSLHAYRVHHSDAGYICINLSSLPRVNSSMRKFFFRRELFINKVDS